MNKVLRIWIVIVVVASWLAISAAAQPRGAAPSIGLVEAASGPIRADQATEDQQAVLSTAYPNPFRVRTTFTLNVEETQRVRVAVYNVLGQRVRLLHDGILTAGTPHHFTFTAGALPSGLYFYRAEGATFVAVRRVALVR